MLIWKNTSLLDEYLGDLEFTGEKSKAKIAVLGSKTIDPDEFPSLKGVYRAGIGVDNVPIADLRRRNIKLGFPSERTAELICEETAAFTCFLILRMLYHKVFSADFSSSRKMLSEQKLLVIGNGKIGKRVVHKMRAFLIVTTYDLLQNEFGDLHPFIANADCISLHIPLTKDNFNFFDQEKLAWMKEGAILINTSRGNIVSEDALFDEISQKRIKAAFDVFWTKPYNGKLKQFHPDYFLMTPHIAGKSDSGIRGTAEDLKLFLKGFD
jgi:phosphoglycerate dehydrogenase-like enzyme